MDKRPTAGAVWNIFIAVPAARDVVSMPVVVAAGQQLERFRVAVRLILPTLILTGLVQAYRYIGLNLSALWATSFGFLILAKVALVVAFVVIFLTCPMWRACSPIAGMCKLEDLREPKSAARRELRDWAQRSGNTLLESYTSGPFWARQHRYLIRKEQPGEGALVKRTRTVQNKAVP